MTRMNAPESNSSAATVRLPKPYSCGKAALNMSRGISLGNGIHRHLNVSEWRLGQQKDLLAVCGNDRVQGLASD